MPYKDKEKQKAASAKHYQQNKDAVKERSRCYRRSNFDRMNALKSKPCTDCNVQYPYYVMQFDHLEDKVDGVSRLLRTKGWPAVEAEIAKCELVCANCHAVRTWKRKMDV